MSANFLSLEMGANKGSFYLVSSSLTMALILFKCSDNSVVKGLRSGLTVLTLGRVCVQDSCSYEDHSFNM